MPGYRKLGRSSDQRKALLRNQVTNLLWHGRIETTEARAKEVRGIAEKLITLAVKEYDKSVKVTKEINNEKGQTVTMEVTNDMPSKLHARRQMMAYLYDMKAPREEDETK
ncbi:MAG: bL17 family ribosomal protein, partial [Clostridia bacterium]|nr:bL17 family ribosomal protein [Clostridia bacterium]